MLLLMEFVALWFFIIVQSQLLWNRPLLVKIITLWWGCQCDAIKGSWLSSTCVCGGRGAMFHIINQFLYAQIFNKGFLIGFIIFEFFVKEIAAHEIFYFPNVFPDQNSIMIRMHINYNKLSFIHWPFKHTFYSIHILSQTDTQTFSIFWQQLYLCR